MWEIYAYHNSDSLFGVFNAVAAIMGSGTYLSAVAAVAFCGFVAAMVAYMVAPEKLQGWKWLMTVVLVYGVLFVPRVTVGIVDKTGAGPVKVVANVPFGMAALGGLTSTIGNSITELFETAFQVIPGAGALPAELAYQRNGLMFGSRVIQETRRASLPDPSVRVDIINFIGNCTAYDINDGTISPSDFSKNANLWSLMASTNPARFTPITTPTGLTTDTCAAAYADISSRMAPQVADLTTRLALKLNPSLDATAATASVQNQLIQAYIRSQIADASATATDLVRQNALINAINDAGEMGCQRINDPACMMLATGRASAVASQNAAWINGAKIAEQALPVVRNVAEAVCYAVFPLLVLLLFLSSGRTTVLMLSGYATALIAIQLWPPLFSILNYMATLYAQLDQAAAAEVGGGFKAISLQTASPIYSNAVSAQAVVSWLVVGIPMLAYSLANRLVNFGSTMIGGLAGLQSTIGNASSAAAVGNSSMGNVSMDQRVVTPSTSSPWASRQQDMSGNWSTTAGNGARAIEFLRNAGAVSNRITSSVSESDAKEASKAVESARSDVVSATNERSSALVDAVSKASGGSTSTRSGSGSSASSFEEIGRSADQIKLLSTQASKSTGLSELQVQQIAFNLAAGLNTPGKGLLPVRAEAGASAGKTYAGNLTKNEQEVLSALGSDGIRAFKQFGDRATRDTSFMRSIATESRDGQELASRLGNTTSRVEAAQAAMSQRQSVADRLSTARNQGQEVSVDLAQLPINSDFVRKYHQLAAEYGPESQALRIAMASELANYSTIPTRYFGDGSVAPSSASDVRTAHNDLLQSNVFDPARVSVADRQHDRAVGPRARSAPGAAALGSDLSDVRRDIDQSALGANVDNEIQGFDARNQITRNDDGTVGTRKSQLVSNARHLRDDVTNVVENAKEVWDGATSESEKERTAREERIANSELVRSREATKEVPTMLPPSGRRQ
ncbi:conjugal transfer protein TraG N-terminal domain-containing protein [Rhizobacter sp. Root1221]|uniref:conjugal transfer protein TraG N-terminal domain-containing protein n=1 Tax=Rhizobacter sp. Root1221 TaxID=1736433 RepID=UPI0006F61F38|nr:conjugal transfer protein TraG N-terminal domain-containing protein [Rhizobacter sp. Root1221]KQW02846.1 hypothetical protein ASC87_00360 [Rhizobacter sp. Root1221]